MKFDTWKEIEMTFHPSTVLSFRNFIDIMKQSGNLPQYLRHLDTDLIIKELGEYFYMSLEDE